MKRVADDIVEALADAGTRIGKALRDTSDRTAVRIRRMADDTRDTDRSLASGQSTPSVPLTIKQQAVASGIDNPTQDMRVWRIFGEAQDGLGGLQRGSLAGGQSWTPVDPRGSADFRWDAGLPDENPARFVIEGILRRPSHVTEVRPALPLDGNPGGWPEYLIEDALDAVEIRDVSGVNSPFTNGPGDWSP